MRDTGIGIPAHKQDRLFKSFSQVDSSTTRQFGGTGLGLVISKRLAEFMGGRMWVESEGENGSTFHFTIQVKPLLDGHTVPWDVRRPDLARRRVLVVEDNDTNRRILTGWLESFGMQSTAANDRRWRHLNGFNTTLPLMPRFSISKRPTWTDSRSPRPCENCRAASLFASCCSLPFICGLATHALLARVFRYRFTSRSAQSSCSKRSARALIEGLYPFRKAPASLAFDPAFASRRPLRILMADDNRVNQKVGSSFLEKLGYRAEVVGNGLEVLQALERQPYDIVFLDVQMPEMDGYEAARQLRRRWPDAERPRIIAMTGNAMLGDRERCLEAGMDDYIAKPVRIEELRAAAAGAEPSSSSTLAGPLIQTSVAHHKESRTAASEWPDCPRWCAHHAHRHEVRLRSYFRTCNTRVRRGTHPLEPARRRARTRSGSTRTSRRCCRMGRKTLTRRGPRRHSCTCPLYGAWRSVRLRLFSVKSVTAYRLLFREGQTVWMPAARRMARLTAVFATSTL